MMRFSLLASAVLALAVLPARAQDAPAEEGRQGGYDQAVYNYSCSDGTEIGVAYINMDDGLSLAVVELDGDLYVMENVISGSGARYATTTGEERHVWWSKGNEGMFMTGPEGDDEIVHGACVS